ncbi:MAG: hypothetical protein Q8T08_10135, partial [Ignavibacteria bacterium]|nr:hypothetical protein [Ignavibacteria bacterium]
MMEMRKHWGEYFKGFPNFKPFRIRMMQTDQFDEMDTIMKEIAELYDGVSPIVQQEEAASQESSLPSECRL